jgi:hypothetical protein
MFHSLPKCSVREKWGIRDDTFDSVWRIVETNLGRAVHVRAVYRNRPLGLGRGRFSHDGHERRSEEANRQAERPQSAQFLVRSQVTF